MRKLLTICYDGTAYCGWQVQLNGITVQKTLQKALCSIICEETGISGCSRTDSGVHANMFCCHFDTTSEIPNEKLVMALNAKLPRDIAATNCITVGDDFHARYSCIGKNYIYKIYNAFVRNPFKEKYYLQKTGYIDERLLNEACKAFLGEHDFKSFCSAGSKITDTVRTVSECSIVRNCDDLVFSITADGFLYNMVRIIVGTLFFVNDGKISVSELPEIINSCDRGKAGATAPPHGLYLNRVFYDFNIKTDFE
ncbi:MAG: tRNA pseudouridine(38-40) synthase TruA [Oscillospiraceae bacterium]